MELNWNWIMFLSNVGFFACFMVIFLFFHMFLSTIYQSAKLFFRLDTCNKNNLSLTDHRELSQSHYLSRRRNINKMHTHSRKISHIAWMHFFISTKKIKTLQKSEVVK
jgi:hypothetical protein